MKTAKEKKKAKKKPGMPAVMLGRIGASAAEIWAAQAFITANPSLKDEQGWDYLFQLPGEADRPIGPLDRLPPEVACMVQVKTTTTKDTSVPIALSNWQKMCSGPLPWFVLVVQVDPKNLEPIAAHLVHIDETWCAKVLKRLREVGADAYEELNDRTLNVSWGQHEALAELHGRELSQRIRKAVPNPHDYFERKIRWFNELGYESRARTVSVQMLASDRDELYGALSDLAIGERRTFPSGWRASISDVRFGLKATLKEFGAEAGEMEYRAPSQGRMRLRLESRSGRRRVEIDCDAFRARAVFPFLPEEFDRVRLAGDDLTAVLSSVSEGQRRKLVGSFGFSMPAGLVPLARVRRVVTLGSILIENERDPFSVTLMNGDLISQLHAGGFAPVDPKHRQAIEVLDAALSVCARFGVTDDVLVDVAELLAQAEWASFMAKMTSSKREGPFVAPFDRPVPVGAMFGSVHEAALHLPDRILVQLLGAHGIVTACDPVAGRGARIVVEDGQLVEKLHILSRAAKSAKSQLRGYGKRMQADLKALGCKQVLTPALYAKLMSQK